MTLRARRRRRATTRRATRARDARRDPRAADDASASALERRDDAASGRDVAVDLAVVDALRRAPTDDERARWRKFTREDVAAHARLADGWIVVNERVFDITAFATTHPGFNNAGQVSTALAIARALGREASEEFEEIHSARAWTQLRDFQIGVVRREGDADADASSTRETADARVAGAGVVGERQRLLGQVRGRRERGRVAISRGQRMPAGAVGKRASSRKSRCRSATPRRTRVRSRGVDGGGGESWAARSSPRARVES